MIPTTGHDCAPSAPAPISFDDGNERGVDVSAQILAILVNHQARMAQMMISQLKRGEGERTMEAIGSGMFRSALADGRGSAPMYIGALGHSPVRAKTE